MRRKISLGAFILTCFVALHVTGQDTPPKAADRPPRKGGDSAGMFDGGFMTRVVTSPEFAKKLDLSDDQVQKLKDGLKDLKQKEAELKADQEKAGEEQAGLMTKDDVDEKAVLTAIEKAGHTRTEMAKVKAQQLILIKRTLTPEQRKKMSELVRTHVQQYRQAMQQGGGKADRGVAGKQRWWAQGRPGKHGAGTETSTNSANTVVAPASGSNTVPAQVEPANTGK